MQIIEIDPNKKYVLALPKTSKETASEIAAGLKQFITGDKTILIMYNTEIAVIPADQIVGYTTLESSE